MESSVSSTTQSDSTNRSSRWLTSCGRRVTEPGASRPSRASRRPTAACKPPARWLLPLRTSPSGPHPARGTVRSSVSSRAWRPTRPLAPWRALCPDSTCRRRPIAGTATAVAWRVTARRVTRCQAPLAATVPVGLQTAPPAAPAVDGTHRCTLSTIRPPTSSPGSPARLCLSSMGAHTRTCNILCLQRGAGRATACQGTPGATISAAGMRSRCRCLLVSQVAAAAEGED